MLRAPDERVGDLLSDSNSDASSLGGDAQRRGDASDEDEPAKVQQRPVVARIKRKNSKWYDSDGDDDWNHAASDGDRAEQAPRSEPVTRQAKTVLTPEPVAAAPTKQPPEKRSSFKHLVKNFNLSPFGAKRKGLDVQSPASSKADTPRNGDLSAKPSEAVARMRSPLSDVSSLGDGASVLSNASERRVASGPIGRKMSHDPNGILSDQTTGSDVVSPQGYRNSPAAVDSARRRSNVVMVQSPGGDDGTTARRGSEIPHPVASVGDALSPGQRKVPGAFPGRPDSGVLLEGWLRQKQRRGVKGMKKWNSRYFVLYAKTNEVRYYADVVQSAWGPIPLGEIGSISLRLIQRIGKPSTLKYKGCRLDITCRNTWGTHYADDYVSSSDENSNNNYHEGDVNARTRSSDKANSTPKSSRVYSLMADSPQTAGAWFSMLDSLLIRSANSPRVDVAPSSSSSNKQLKRHGSTAAMATASTKMMTRRRPSGLDTETIIISGPNDHVPKPVLYAINFIFDSSPGIETERFYEIEVDSAKLKAALKFLNQFATDGKRKPSKDELEQALDPVTAGAVVKLWLTQLEQPLVPFEMFDDFRTLAADAKAAPFELSRSLKALVSALPRRNFAMLACILFHLNDVNAYASTNGMDSTVLAAMFGEFIVRRRPSGNNQEDVDKEPHLLRVVVEEMITHVDAIIDEKEADILDRV